MKAIFSKRHYEAIADAVSVEMQSKNYPEEKAAQVRLLYELVALFEQDNPNFDETHFLRACGAKEE